MGLDPGLLLLGKGRSRSPGFRQKATDEQPVPTQQGRHNGHQAACKTTDHAWTRASGGLATRDMGRGQVFQTTHRYIRISLASYAEHPHRGDGDGEPQTLRPRRVDHLGVMPVPAPTLSILETALDPTAQTIPDGAGVL